MRAHCFIIIALLHLSLLEQVRAETPTAECGTLNNSGADEDAVYASTWSTIEYYEQQGRRQAATAKAAGSMGRDASPYFLAWNLAREKYRKISLKGGDRVLRNAEHYLFRKWIAYEKVVIVPDGVPFLEAGRWNPTLLMTAPLMEFFHDPIYNMFRGTIGERVWSINKTTPDMYFFEQAGYADGEYLQKHPNARWSVAEAVEAAKAGNGEK